MESSRKLRTPLQFVTSEITANEKQIILSGSAYTFLELFIVNFCCCITFSQLLVVESRFSIERFHEITKNSDPCMDDSPSPKAPIPRFGGLFEKQT